MVLLLALVGAPEAEAAPAATTPPTVAISLFAPQVFAFAGVVQVPTVDGPLKVLVLVDARGPAPRLPTAHPDGVEEYGLAARSLDLRGNVTEQALAAPDVIVTDGLRLEAS
ncbi:hypothetical protein ABZY81_36160 [Streptomyces sp. NPDC006514]|uniref:hypothetical protein n=1 Tax=Streptomyces sp. NPDC006514 TaxID=3154308 RepID=UPI00339E5519